MRQLEAFSGVRVLIYVLMSNHFHLLCQVPQAQELSETELLDRIQAGYGPARRQALDQELAHLRQAVAKCRERFGEIQETIKKVWRLHVGEDAPEERYYRRLTNPP